MSTSQRSFRFGSHDEGMETNDVNARLAALQARRPAPTAGSTTRPVNPLTGRARRPHPARKARIASTVMSAAAMVGITSYMVAQDHTASASATSATVVSAATSASMLVRFLIGSTPEEARRPAAPCP